MSKKAFFKKLLIAGMCVISATATAGLAASCSFEKPDHNQNQTETTKYTVKYDNKNIGEKPKDLTNVTKLPDTLPVLTDNDYDFGGWFTDSECKTPAVAGATIDKATTLYAKWTAKPPVIKTYTISFVSEHGTKPADLTEQTKLPDTLPVLSDNYYDFGGWFTDSECKTPAVAGATIDKATTLYAKWTAKPPVIKTYTISFVSEHGEKPADLTEQTKLPDTLPVLSDNDYDFGGWFTDSECKTPAVAGATIDKATTLYAKWTAKPPVIKTYTISFVSEHGSKPANLTEQTKLPDPLPELTDNDYDFGGWFTDSEYNTKAVAGATIDKATTLYAKWTAKQVTPPPVTTYSVTFDMHGIGNAPAAQAITPGQTATVPSSPTASGYTFNGWYTTDYFTEQFDFDNTAINEDTTVYACWLETVTRKLDHGKAQRAAGLENNEALLEVFEFGGLKYEIGTRFELNHNSGGLKGDIVNTQGKKVYLTLTSDATITFKARDASGNREGKKVRIYSVDDNGKATVAGEKGFNSDNAENFTFQNLSAGNYYIVYEIASNNAGNAMRMGEISVTEQLVVSDAESISITLLRDEYLCGTAFDEDTLTVKLRYKSGRVDILDASKYTVDKSQFKSNESGKHSISVSYNDSNVEAKSAEVYVYKINSIKVYDYYLTKDRVTVNLQKIFKKGNAFSTDGLVIRADCSVTGIENKNKTFTLDVSQVDISYGSMAATGKKTVTITEKLSSSYKKTASYEINVVDLTGADKKLVKVDSAASSVSVNNGVLVVKTINDALCAIKLLGASTSEQKVIEVAAGTYKEKVEVNIPNVKIKGTGAKAGDTVLVYDALNGLLDPAGKVGYNTDGSATISIRESAYNFSAENIEFRNYYNTNALYEQSKTIAPSGTQAVATLVQADKVVFNNVRFSSYHDTLYDMTGRHVYENCYIEGRTDYIFGYNSTAYFHNTTLMTLGANKDKNNLIEKNGGYVVATKGINRGGDNVKYGYIFDGCTFTADEYVTPGTVSFARAWDKYMTMMVMNSTISGAYSKDALNDNSGKNKRYEKMSGTSPNASLLYEYNNAGAGAISSSLTNTCTVTSKNEADKFADFTQIFAAVNGNQKYSDDWDGSVEISNDDDLTLTKNTTWNFGKVGDTPYSGEVKNGATDVFNKLTIAANNNGSFVKNNDWYKMTYDATVTMKVKKGATIKIATYDGHLVMKLNGTDVTPASVNENGLICYEYTATEDGELVLTTDSSNQAYIGVIYYTAPAA